MESSSPIYQSGAQEKVWLGIWSSSVWWLKPHEEVTQGEGVEAEELGAEMGTQALPSEGHTEEEWAEVTEKAQRQKGNQESGPPNWAPLRVS